MSGQLFLSEIFQPSTLLVGQSPLRATIQSENFRPFSGACSRIQGLVTKTLGSVEMHNSAHLFCNMKWGRFKESIVANIKEFFPQRRPWNH